ncbi:MAG: hypothetical protein K2M64_02540, partial [Clostridia bacterium]|nr:hypothetical protein [Clostridia bacterium]
MALYVDIGISAVLVLALIIGAIRGFAKQFNGLLCALVEIAGSIGLALLIVPALQNAGTLNGFSATAAGWFNGEQFTATILSEADLQEALSQGFLKILTGLSPQIWAKMEANGMTTLGMY